MSDIQDDYRYATVRLPQPFPWQILLIGFMAVGATLYLLTRK